MSETEKRLNRALLKHSSTVLRERLRAQKEPLRKKTYDERKQKRKLKDERDIARGKMREKQKPFLPPETRQKKLFPEVEE